MVLSGTHRRPVHLVDKLMKLIVVEVGMYHIFGRDKHLYAIELNQGSMQKI